MPEGNLHGHMTGLGTLGGHLQGSGTTDYNELDNRPQINNHTLEGNQTSSDLGLQDEISFPGTAGVYLDGTGAFSTPAGTGGSYAPLTDKPQINGVELDGNLSLTDLDIQEEINFPGNAAVFLNGEGNFTAAGSSDYDPLTNKPQINGHTLSGNQTSSDLGLQDAISFPGNTGQYLNGAGVFTAPTVSYTNVTDKPSINGHTLEDNQTSSGLGLQDALNFGGDAKKYLSDTGSFTSPYSVIDDDMGSIVSFSSDGNYALLHCETDFQFTQDLHGYDHPWKGGDGKNKLNNTLTTGSSSGVDYTINSDGTISTSGISTTVVELMIPVTIASGDYYFSGCVDGGSNSTYDIYVYDSTAGSRVKKWDGITNSASCFESDDYEQIKLDDTHTITYRIRIRSGVDMNGKIFKPMICSSTASDPAEFEPYENICPITGVTDQDFIISTTTSEADGMRYTFDFDGTYYKGTADAGTGDIIETYGYIATYAGEVLPGEWISDRDVYEAGQSPSTGAEVIYELLEPIASRAGSGIRIISYEGINYVWSGSGSGVTVTYAVSIPDPVLAYLINDR